jgi:uncharacterized protein DUF5999
MCQHKPSCPPWDAVDRQAAHVVAAHPEQGWSLLCNGVVLFDDDGELLPDGRAVPPRPPALLPARHRDLAAARPFGYVPLGLPEPPMLRTNVRTPSCAATRSDVDPRTPVGTALPV